MGKSIKVRYELRDSVEMVGLVQTLKDIADNKFYTLMAKKDHFQRFGESFVDFFRMLNFTKIQHPLISNQNKTVGVVVITIEGSFLAQFNNSIVRLALAQKEKYDQVKYIAVGEKSLDQLKPHDPNIKVFLGMEAQGLYEMSMTLKNYLVEEIMQGRLGKVVICHAWPKDFETLKFRVNKLLPCDDLVSKQNQFADEFANTIEESDTKSIMEYLTNLWIATRIYEIFVDTVIASAAAQSAFLDERIDKMKKEVLKTRLKYRKARKSDIDKGLRETFVARMMTMKE